MENKYTVSEISMTKVVAGKREYLSFLDAEITDNLMQEIKQMLGTQMLCQLDLQNSENDTAMSVFCENGTYHVGIVDMYNDMNYYYDNGSGDQTLVDIDGNMFEARMVGKDLSVLWQIILTFAQEGKRCERVAWSEE